MRALVLLCLCSLPASADVVELRGGGKLSGEIESESEAEVVLRMPAGRMVVPRARIARIVREQSQDYLRREAKSRLSSGSTGAAVELYEKALRLDPEARRPLADALAAHIDASLEGFQLPRAEQALARLKQISPNHARFLELRAAVAGERKRADQLWRTAQRQVRDGSFQAAIQTLQAWRLRQPSDDPRARRELATLHEAAGGRAVEQGQLRAALDHFRAARAFGASGDVVRAIELLRPIAVLEALKGDRRREAGRLIARGYPTPGVTRFLEAVSDQLAGDMQKAVAGYAEAERAAAVPSSGRKGIGFEVVRSYARATLRAAITKPPREGAAKWSETFLAPLRTARQGVVIAYAPTSEMASKVARFAESELRASVRELQLRIDPAIPVEVVIHADQSAYVSADRNPEGTPLGANSVGRAATGGVTYRTLDEDGKSLLRVETFTGQSTLFETVIPHEMVHVAQHFGFKAFRRAHWLDEGMAMLRESKGGRAQRRAWLKRSSEVFSLEELTSLRSTPPNRAFLFYNQSYAFTDYLRNLGSDRDWRSFLDRMATQPVEQAIRESFGIESLGELERGFLAATGLRR